MPLFVRLVVAATATLCLALAGCESNPDRDEAPDASRLEGTWGLTELRGSKVSELLAQGGKVPTFVYDGNGKVSGTSGINRYSTSADMAALERGKLSFSPVISTKMAGPPHAMKVEVDFLNTLGESETYRFDGDLLEFRRGSVRTMRFVKE